MTHPCPTRRSSYLTQAQAVSGQQRQFTVDAGKRGERRIALELGDRKPPGPVAAGIGTMRMDLTGPAQAVAPALAAILVGGDDAGHAASVAIPASTPAAAVRRARRGCNPDLRRPGLLARRLLIFGCR